MKTTAVTPGKDHEPFWGVILPIDHPFWTKHKPGDRWGCKCGLRSTDAPIKPPIDDAWNDPIYDPSVGLDNNPGKDAMLFSKKHSYVTHAYKGAKKVVEVYAPKIMANKSRKNIRDFFKKATENKSLQVHVETNKTNVASISFQDVKKVTGKPHKFAYERNMLLHFLPEVLKRAKFIGSSQDKKPTSRGHSEVKLWHYYEIKINNEPSFIIVKETKKGEFTVHSIQDNDHFDRSKIEIRP